MTNNEAKLEAKPDFWWNRFGGQECLSFWRTEAAKLQQLPAKSKRIRDEEKP
jgi:hypothetical protein